MIIKCVLPKDAIYLLINLFFIIFANKYFDMAFLQSLFLIAFLAGVGLISALLYGMYTEDTKFHKNLKKREEFAKSIDKFVITVEYVSEKKPEPSPCQKPKWLASSSSSPRGKAINPPSREGLWNAPKWSLPRKKSL